MKIILKHHAKIRMIQYNINEQIIRDTLINSTETIKDHNSNNKYLSYKFLRKDHKKIITEYLVLVHTDKTSKIIYIITLYITSKRRLKGHGFIIDK